VIVDDVLATGGTACAAIDLVRRTGADVVALAVIMDLPSLGGRARVQERGVAITALLDGDAPVH
jgi:adenine phosphoribosyltransferase